MSSHRIIQASVIFVAGACAAVVGFFFWASAGTVPKESYATIERFGPEVEIGVARDTFSVVTYNVGYLSGLTNNRPIQRSPLLFEQNLDLVVAMLAAERPSIVALQEIDFDADRSFRVDQLAALAERAGYAVAARAVNWDERYVPFPYGRPSVHFGRVVSGQAVLSRFRIEEAKRVVLERADKAFYYDAFYLDRLAQVVRIDVGRPLVVINVHFESRGGQTREMQARRVADLYETYRRAYPVIVLGDFNAATPGGWDPTLVRRHPEYEPPEATIDILLEAEGLQEAFGDLGGASSAAFAYTFPSDRPAIKIDHVFYDAERIAPVASSVLRGDVAPPSDHLPVVMRFVFVGK